MTALETTTGSWQEAAAHALQDIWFGGVVVAEKRASWIDDAADSLPTLEELAEADGFDREDVRSLFTFIGALAAANSNLYIGNVLDTVIGKQRDYGHGNILKYGLMGITIRLSDKLERLKNLVATGASPSNESVADTHLDIVGYALIALMLLDDTFTRELA